MITFLAVIGALTCLIAILLVAVLIIAAVGAWAFKGEEER